MKNRIFRKKQINKYVIVFKLNSIGSETCIEFYTGNKVVNYNLLNSSKLSRVAPL